MATSATWDAAAGVAACPIVPWASEAWRGHRPKYAATDTGGARLWSARFHCGASDPPAAETICREVRRRWTALYLGLSREVCIGEILRHTTPELLPQLNHRYTRLRVALERVLDCRDLGVLGLTGEDLWRDTDYCIPQRLALAALDRSVEGLLVPSATRLGDNFILFPEVLRSGSSITIVDHIDPNLYVHRP